MRVCTKLLPGLLCVLLLSAAKAQQLVVTVESPSFTLDTRLASGPGSDSLVTTTSSPAFTLDTRIVSSSANPLLVLGVESSAFSLDTRLSAGAGDAPLVTVTVSSAFTLDTRFMSSEPSSTLILAALSPVFTLDTRLAERRGDLIVEAVSPAFDLNTMWVRLRKIALTLHSPLDLYWTTNAAAFPFRPQVTDPPLGPSSIWQDVTDPISESDGLYHVPVAPTGTNRYFRLKL